MITTIEQAKAIAKEWNKIKKDKDRYPFLVANANELMIVLDNDMTMVRFITDEDMDELLAKHSKK